MLKAVALSATVGARAEWVLGATKERARGTRGRGVRHLTRARLRLGSHACPALGRTRERSARG